MTYPQRICIIGNSGSGKSTLAKALGAQLGLPALHLDRHLLTGDFVKLPAEKYMSIHGELIANDSWIIDGNCNKVIAERVARATLVVFLDISRAIAVPCVFRRALGAGQPADTVPDGARAERLSREFLLWTMRYSRRERIKVLRRLCEETGVPLLLVKAGGVEDMANQVVAHTG